MLAYLFASVVEVFTVAGVNTWYLSAVLLLAIIGLIASQRAKYIDGVAYPKGCKPIIGHALVMKELLNSGCVHTWYVDQARKHRWQPWQLAVPGRSVLVTYEPKHLQQMFSTFYQ